MKTEDEILNEYKKTFFINEINERLKDISELLTNNSLSKDDLQINLYDLPELNDEYTMNLSQDSIDKLIDKFKSFSFEYSKIPPAAPPNLTPISTYILFSFNR